MIDLNRTFAFLDAAGDARKDVLNDVATERSRQDFKWGGAIHDDEHSIAEFVQLIEDCAGRARAMAGRNSPHEARKFGLKVSIINKADPVRLAAARSRQEANAILKSANSTVSVVVRG